MRHILVTGANKGIGLAIVEAILAEHADTLVHLASRDAERGRTATQKLVEKHADWSERIEVVELDVSDERSVAAAEARVAASLGGGQLYGIVNTLAYQGCFSDPSLAPVPIKLKEIADQVGMHESTIQRVLSGDKVLRCERGLIRLDAFLPKSRRKRK